MADRPHIQFPFRRDPVTGKVVVVEQDSPEHIASCEAVIVSCPTGFRTDRPEFGWPFPTFRAQPLNLDALEAALRRFEPRSEARATNVLDDAWAAVERLRTGVADVEVEIPVAGARNG